MKQLEETFQELLQGKISFEATMNAVKENTCPECKHPLIISYQSDGPDDFSTYAYCDYCGNTYTE